MSIPPSVFASVAPADLLPWVESFWYSEGTLPSLQERVLPSATCDIVANLGAPMWLEQQGQRQRVVGSTTTGLLTAPMLLTHPTFHVALGLRLTPLGLGAILRLPPAALLDQTHQVQAVLGTAADAFAERCAEANAPEARLAAAVGWVRERLGTDPRRPDAVVAWAMRAIDTSGGTTRVSALVSKSGYSETAFASRFVQELGMSPKRYARLVRFRRALDLLSPLASLADTALRAGFSDQAHMHRDFRLFAHATPREVLVSRYPAGLTLAE